MISFMQRILRRHAESIALKRDYASATIVVRCDLRRINGQHRLSQGYCTFAFPDELCLDLAPEWAPDGTLRLLGTVSVSGGVVARVLVD